MTNKAENAFKNLNDALPSNLRNVLKPVVGYGGNIVSFNLKR